MTLSMNNLTPHIRQLPVSLRLNNDTEYTPPIKSNGYIIDPSKFQDEIKDYEMNLKEIKALLLMMVKGDDGSMSSLLEQNGHTIDELA